MSGYLGGDYAIAQHFGQSGSGGDHYAPDFLTVERMMRVYGRDENAEWLVADGVAVPTEPSSLGYRNDAALWYPSGLADPDGIVRPLGLWADAYPGVVTQSGSGTTSDVYRSNVQSATYVTPAFRQDANDPTAWVPDTGLIQQRVSVAGGQDLPTGTPVVVLPFSITTEQAMAAIPAGGTQLVAVWKGGASVGRYGTLEYDVRPDGSLDVERRARLQTADRIWRLPTQGLLAFGAVPGADKKPFPPSSSIAWQVGLDVDSQAGYGSIVDQVAGPAPTPPPPDPTTPASVSGATGTVSRPGTGGAAGASGVGGSTTGKPGGAPGTTGTTSVIALTGRRAFGGHSVGQVDDKHRIAVTPDGEPVNCAHWNVLEPIDGDGYDAPIKTAGIWIPAGDGGPLIHECFLRYDPNDSHPFLNGTREGLRKIEVKIPVDVTPRDKKTGGIDKSGGKDNGKDNAFDKGGGKDNGDDVGVVVGGISEIPFGAKGGKQPDGGRKTPDDGGGGGFTGSGVKVIADHNRPRVPIPGPAQATGSTPSSDGPKITPFPFDPNAPPFNPFGPIQDVQPPPLAPASTFSFGGGILYGSSTPQAQGSPPQDGEGTISVDRGYARTPLEFAAPAFLGRPIPLHGIDLRGRTDVLTPDQKEVYDLPTAISGMIVAVGSQQTGVFVHDPNNGPGVGMLYGGAAEAGGFAVLPPTVDVRSWQQGFPNPIDLPRTTFWAGPGAQFGVADVTLGGLPKDGYTWGRGGNTTCSFDWWDSNGLVGGATELPPAIFLDSGRSPVDPPPSCLIWGGQVVAVWNTTNGQAAAGSVFVADGTNVGPGGTWQAASSVTGANPGWFGDGSDGAAVLNGGAVTGCSLVGTVYAATRDLYFASLSFAATYSLFMGSYRLSVSGTATIGATNSINVDGKNAAGAVAGAAIPSATLGASAVGGVGQTQASPGAGGNGASTSSSAGASGGGGGTAQYSVIVPPAPSAGGVAAAPAANLGFVRTVPQILTGRLTSAAGEVSVTGGAGGGGGTYQDDGLSRGISGAGGGGGGVLQAAIFKLLNSGRISANGGAGANGSALGPNSGCGGGGGGGGGAVLLVYGLAGSTLGTVQALGGAFGTGDHVGSATGATGVAGSAGTVIKIAV